MFLSWRSEELVWMGEKQHLRRRRIRMMSRKRTKVMMPINLEEDYHLSETPFYPLTYQETGRPVVSRTLFTKGWILMNDLSSVKFAKELVAFSEPCQESTSLTFLLVKTSCMRKGSLGLVWVRGSVWWGVVCMTWASVSRESCTFNSVEVTSLSNVSLIWKDWSENRESRMGFSPSNFILL